jgi:hypothetical protein
MSKVHSAFEVIPDKAVAEVFSEALTSDYTAYGDGPAEAGFPPEPAHIVSIFGAYLTPSSSNNIARRIALLDPDSDRAMLAELYRHRVSGIIMTEPLLPSTLDSELHEKYKELVIANQRRLLVAHMVGKLARTGELMDALVYPKIIKEQMPLYLRQIALDISADLGLQGSLNQRQQNALRMFTTQAPIVQENIGVQATRGFLISPEHFKAAVTTS